MRAGTVAAEAMRSGDIGPIEQVRGQKIPGMGLSSQALQVAREQGEAAHAFRGQTRDPGQVRKPFKGWPRPSRR